MRFHHFKLTPSQIERAKAMRAADMGFHAIAAVLKSSYDRVRRAIDPVYRERRNERARSYGQQRQHRDDKCKGAPSCGFVGSDTRVHIPCDVEADRFRRIAAPRTLTALVLGDPAPGQSALDKKRTGVGA